MTILTRPEPRTKPGLMPSLINPDWTAGRTDPTNGLYALIEVEGLELAVSRLEGETSWTIDGAYKRGLPIFVNGYGARYLATKTLKLELGWELDLNTPKES